ncbi:MAG: hypothetical protein JWP97_2517 [Labilithrix sp.]|nr:hypothetical protein [Labilithrix sp.]
MALAKLIAEILADVVIALVKADGDEAATEDALIDAEFRLARLRAERRRG